MWVSKDWKNELMPYTLNDKEKRVLREGAATHHELFLENYHKKRWRKLFIDTMQYYDEDGNHLG